MNLRRYLSPVVTAAGTSEPVSVLIPARDEEANIGNCLEHILASTGVPLEVLVLDDASTDRTAAIVSVIAEADARVRLLRAPALPAGWNGKQRACWLLAQQATAPHLLFLDADVRLHPEAIARCAAIARARNLPLLSGFPRQITIGWMERLLLPLIHFVLLSFLPMGAMRRSTSPGFAAGCGQLFLAERQAYFASGGHAAIRETRHDGLRLPQLFRRHGFATDIFDLTTLASVRMYSSARAVWLGLAKNATEGIATPARIVPFTILLVLGQVLPLIFFLLWCALAIEFLVVGASPDQPALALTVGAAIVIAFVASYLPRLLAVRRFRQPLSSALIHPIGIVMLLVVQWYALLRQLLGRPVAWRARSYASTTGEEVP